MKSELNTVYLDMECEAINAPSQYKHRLQHSASQCLLSVEKYQSTRCQCGWFPCCFTAKPLGGWRGGRAAQKQEVVYVHFSVWLCVCARTCECPCVRGRLRVWEKEGRFFFLCEPKCLTGSFALKTLTIGRLGKFGWGKWMRNDVFHLNN